MENGLYHYDVFWEIELQKQINSILNSNLPLKFSCHALENKLKRKISTSNITLDYLKSGFCFEAEVNTNKVVKFAIRNDYNNAFDISSVWIINSDCLFCKTIWLNNRNDKHSTLDKNKYVTY